MSSRQLDDAMEARHTKALAEASGMSEAEVEQWVIDDYPEASDDGLVYGHIIELSDEAPAELIERLGGTSINVGPIGQDEDE